jgi:hypothetical protein
LDLKKEPALKGFVFQGLWEDLNALLRDGKLARETAELRLAAVDLELLDAKLEPTLWYPNASYLRLAGLLAETLGVKDDERFWVERGRQAVQRLLAKGGPVQTIVEGARSFGQGAGRALMKLPKVVLSYGEWSFERPAENTWVVDMRDAAALPDSLRLSFQGAAEWISRSLTGRETRAASARVAADHVRFEGRMA